MTTLIVGEESRWLYEGAAADLGLVLETRPRVAPPSLPVCRRCGERGTVEWLGSHNCRPEPTAESTPTIQPTMNFTPVDTHPSNHPDQVRCGFVAGAWVSGVHRYAYGPTAGAAEERLRRSLAEDWR